MIDKKIVGNFSGNIIEEYTLKNKNQMEISILNYGGVVRKIMFPDKYGNFDNRILTYKDINMYEENPMFFGAIIGRIAGRIKQGQYTLPKENKIFQLEKNEHGNHLHGGNLGFHHRLWQIDYTKSNSSKLYLNLIDREQNGYPGNLNITVEYSLDDDNNFKIKYTAFTDKNTICNMTNHMYFNLLGSKVNEDITNHYLQIDAEKIAEVDDETLPTWRYLHANKDKIFDFRTMRSIGKYGMDKHSQQKIVHGGFDHAFKLSKEANPNIVLVEKKSGIKIEVNTDEEAVVLYTCNKVHEPHMLEHHPLVKYAGITIETQALPDRINSDEPCIVLITPDKPYQSETCYKFINLT